MFNADAGNAGYRWPVVKLRQGCDAEVTLLSHEFFCLTTHFVRVTVPCSIDDCALCDVLPARGLFYLAVMCQGRRSLVELGVFSANDLEQHCKLLHGGMGPGLVVRLERRGKKTPVRSEVTGRVDGCGGIDPLTLAQRVLAIYKLPCCNPADTIATYEARVRTIVQGRNRALVERLGESQTRRV